MVCDEVVAVPELHATIQDGRDPELACVAALGANRLQRPGPALPQRLPIKWKASAGGGRRGERVYQSPHRLLCRTLPIHGPASKVEGQHFPTCALMRVHCMNCRLTVPVGKMAAHDCVMELNVALKSMLIPR